MIPPLSTTTYLSLARMWSRQATGNGQQWLRSLLLRCKSLADPSQADPDGILPWGLFFTRIEALLVGCLVSP
jgi:hypothetical protein